MHKMHFILHYMLYGLQTKVVCNATENGSCCVVCEWGSGHIGRAGGVTDSLCRIARAEGQLSGNRDHKNRQEHCKTL